MAQSFSDYSMGSESDSSKEETIYDTIRATAEKPGGVRMEESQGDTLVIRVVIQDLQQTVSSSEGWCFASRLLSFYPRLGGMERGSTTRGNILPVHPGLTGLKTLDW